MYLRSSKFPIRYCPLALLQRGQPVHDITLLYYEIEYIYLQLSLIYKSFFCLSPKKCTQFGMRVYTRISVCSRVKRCKTKRRFFGVNDVIFSSLSSLLAPLLVAFFMFSLPIVSTSIFCVKLTALRCCRWCRSSNCWSSLRKASGRRYVTTLRAGAALCRRCYCIFLQSWWS